jgi:hypothetical protein
LEALAALLLDFAWLDEVLFVDLLDEVLFFAGALADAAGAVLEAACALNAKAATAEMTRAETSLFMGISLVG